MTENEIIEILQTEKACVTRAMKNECNRDCYNCDLCEEGKDILTVYDAVINALDENQQYRELGTVEEILKVFNNQRTIIATQHETVKQYRAIGTIEELQALKEEVELYRNLDKTNFSDGYNRAIDEFAEALKKEISFKYSSGQINHAYRAKEKTLKLIDEIAEQLKGGAE